MTLRFECLSLHHSSPQSMWVSAVCLQCNERTFEYTVSQPGLFLQVCQQSSQHQRRPHFKSLKHFQPLHVQCYSQHPLQLLLSHHLQLQGHSRDSSPPGIWFNPDQMLIGAVYLLAICLGCWSTVAICAMLGLPAKFSAAQRPLHNQRTLHSQSLPINTYCEQTPQWVTRSNWSFHDSHTVENPYHRVSFRKLSAWLSLMQKPWLSELNIILDCGWIRVIQEDT